MGVEDRRLRAAPARERHGPPLEPQRLAEACCREFLASIDGDSIPASGVPTGVHWGGERATLALL
eukprot:4188227-Pyramimonas_sp.AAC.1